jgi:hypothetical protein
MWFNCTRQPAVKKQYHPVGCPVLFIISTKPKFLPMKKTVYILGSAALELIVIGTFFKRMHWPGANVILGISAIAVVVAIPVIAVYLYKWNCKCEE